jgi:hypothetical protein
MLFLSVYMTFINQLQDAHKRANRGEIVERGAAQCLAPQLGL